MGNTTIGKAMIGITSTAKGKGLNKSLKTALSPTFQPPACQALAGQTQSNQALSEHPVHPTFPRNKHKNSKPTHLQQLKRISVQAAKQLCVWLVQGAAIYINIAAPCTTEIHTENQHFTLRVKPRVQPRFLHRLLLLCFSCNPVIPKNKKSPETFPFFGQNPYICISSKSKAKQCSETRTATKSLPATELSTL